MMIVVIMGVCGSGKSTIGEALAKDLFWTFADADDFHSEANKNKMAQGLPLNDQDRIPWLSAIHDYMQKLTVEGSSGVLTCSALKVVYREILRNGYHDILLIDKTEMSLQSAGEVNPLSDSSTTSKTRVSVDPVNSQQNSNSCPLNIHLVHLHGKRSVLEQRLKLRRGHFMPPGMLDSQLKTLEPLTAKEQGFVVDIDNSPENILAEIRKQINV